MLGFLPPVVRGVVAFLLLVINTLFWCALLFVCALVKLALPFAAVRRRIDPLLNAIATAWIACNGAWMRLTQRTAWDVAGVAVALTGMGLIMITHDMGVVAETADRVIVQYKGKKMEEADVLSLFENPQSNYTRALLSALPENAVGDRLPTVSDFVFEPAPGVR